MTDTLEHHRKRSDFIRGLVQRSTGTRPISDRYAEGIPKTIVQFWHNPNDVPKDVQECIASWKRLSPRPFAHRLFNEDDARAFIGNFLGRRYARAFERCYHPAMQADYFRLCYIFVEGGFYVDADDVCIDTDIDWLFLDGRLKVQPLCYDVASAAMVTASAFMDADAYSPDWIFYFNNNPLIASRAHPVIERALQQATDRLVLANEDDLPEIQTTTGPGNLSKSIFDLGATSGDLGSDLVVLRDWEARAISRWPLAYRSDARNWRHSNRQRFGWDSK